MTIFVNSHAIKSTLYLSQHGGGWHNNDIDPVFHVESK
jgi:hypothetical protein